MALNTLGSVGFDKYIPFSTTSEGVVDFGNSNIATPKVTAREFVCVDSLGCGKVSITDTGITIDGETITTESCGGRLLFGTVYACGINASGINVSDLYPDTITMGDSSSPKVSINSNSCGFGMDIYGSNANIFIGDPGFISILNSSGNGTRIDQDYIRTDTIYFDNDHTLSIGVSSGGLSVPCSTDISSLSVGSFMEGSPGNDGKGAYTSISCGMVKSTRGADMCFSGSTAFPKAVFTVDADGLKMLVKTSANTSGGYCVDSNGVTQIASTNANIGTLTLAGSQSFRWGNDGDVQDGSTPVTSGSASVLRAY